MGQLVREWLARGDFDRLRCLELLIVKGWANKDVAKYLEPDRAGGGQLQVPDHRPAQGDGPPRRPEPRTPGRGLNRWPPNDHRRSTPRPSGPTCSTRCRPGPSPGSRRRSATRPSCAAQLEDVRQNRTEAGLHTLGAIWRRSRLTCPSRQQLGSLLLDALDPDLADYLTFHIEVVECPFCQANLADLKGKAEPAATAARTRHDRILQSSRHLLGDDGRA